MKDYYKILELKRTDNIEEIKKAFRKLSYRYHPDKNNNDSEYVSKFQDINEAYTVLSNNDKRVNHINELNESEGNKVPINNMSKLNQDEIYSLIESLNNEMGNNLFKQKSQKPAPLIITIEVDILRAYMGTNESIEIKRWIIEEEIKREEIEMLYVPIPMGIDNNEIIIIKDKGNILDETNKGDVKIYIKVINNTKFIRDGMDLIYKKHITLKESLCGFSFNLEFIDGKKYIINNNKGNIIASGAQKIIDNMGIKRKGYTGNLIIKFSVNYPETLSNNIIDKLEKIL